VFESLPGDAPTETCRWRAGALETAHQSLFERANVHSRLRMARSDALTHLDSTGAARMVDVGAKQPSDRRAVARAVIAMTPETAAAVATGDLPKGDVVATARIAGIQAAKRTAELVPLCHPLPLSFVDVRVEVEAEGGRVEIEGEARTTAQTGVEMEAMCACSVAALTVYDMVKGLERGVEVTSVRLVEKSGGKEHWRRGGSAGRAGELEHGGSAADAG
jgi:cyclic pyranopterin monophosphate synthase